MALIRLEKQRAKKLDAQAELNSLVKGTERLRIHSHLSHIVDYDDDNTHFTAELKQWFESADNPDGFRINVVVEGRFSAERALSGEEKRRAHVESYDLLYPFMQSLAAQMSEALGLPAFKPPHMEIDADKVIFEDSEA